MSDRLQQARDGGLESSERAKFASSNHFKVDQPGKRCLVSGRFVASLNDVVEPPLRVPWTCFEISLGRFRIGLNETPVRQTTARQGRNPRNQPRLVFLSCENYRDRELFP